MEPVAKDDFTMTNVFICCSTDPAASFGIQPASWTWIVMSGRILPHHLLASHRQACSSSLVWMPVFALKVIVSGESGTIFTQKAFGNDG